MAISKPKNTLAGKEKASVTKLNEVAMQGEDFYNMVSEAAYYRAEKRNFAAGYELEDWIAAEEEIQELQKESLVA